MTRSVLLTITSLLANLLFMFHVSDDFVRGLDTKDGYSLLFGVIIWVVWAYGALVLAGRRSGYIVMLVFGALASFVPVLHMSGEGLIGGKVAGDSSGAFFWAWTNIALDVTAVFSVILAVRCLWSAVGSVPGDSPARNLKLPASCPSSIGVGSAFSQYDL